MDDNTPTLVGPILQADLRNRNPPPHREPDVDYSDPPTVPVMKGKRRIGWKYAAYSAERAAIEYRANAAEKTRLKKFRKLQKKRGVR